MGWGSGAAPRRAGRGDGGARRAPGRGGGPIALTAEVARRLAARTGQLTEICFATTEPTVGQAISRLRARGAEEIMVAPWFLAPGLLTDRLVAAAPDVVHADVIGAHPALSAIVWERYDAALANTLTLSA
ncbi:CbiX/SirB N-terminal domain-containing protein [Nocardia brasiliensis]|uniref:CbiX/SirB N-terminal domain-containing protein n=1 Tax=Nocardia brasiliensis TaxID=37326 RepID=UPI00313ACD2B